MVKLAMRDIVDSHIAAHYNVTLNLGYEGRYLYTQVLDCCK